MREWCGCGAAIRARRHDVLKWRNDHNHPGTQADPEPERNGAHAQVEHAGHRYFETNDHPVINARVGFQMEPRRWACSPRPSSQAKASHQATTQSGSNRTTSSTTGNSSE